MQILLENGEHDKGHRRARPKSANMAVAILFLFLFHPFKISR
jgi:hypothetical protein